METLGGTRPLLDEQFDVLGHAARRRLLVALLKENPRADTPEVDGSEDDIESPGQRIALRHNHLPRLEDRGYIRWNQENSRVTKGPKFEEIEPLLALLDDHRDELSGKWL